MGVGFLVAVPLYSHPCSMRGYGYRAVRRGHFLKIRSEACAVGANGTSSSIERQAKMNYAARGRAVVAGLGISLAERAKRSAGSIRGCRGDAEVPCGFGGTGIRRVASCRMCRRGA
ncbi:MAG TPA: hypothetical protein VGJ20_35525 [Xanthobacteraceae bacterium]